MTATTAVPVGGTRARTTAATVLALQGGAALLFAFSQVVRVFNPDWLLWIEPLDGLFKSGNLAITVLLATEGFAVATVLRESRSVREAVRRILVYVVVVWLLLALVCLGAVGVRAFDDTDTQSWEVTRQSVLHVLTFSWNTWISDHPMTVRADLVSLWYFSIAMQLLAVVTVVGLVLRRWPRLLGAVLLVGAVGATTYRIYSLETDGWFSVALDTFARADAFLLGAAVVFLLRPLPAKTGAGLSGGSLLCLLGLVIASSFLDVDQIFTYQIPLAAVLTALFVAGARAPVDVRTLTVQLLGAKDTLIVARAWRDLVAWSLFVVILVQRHATDQPAVAVTSTVVFVLAVVVVASRSVLDHALSALATAVGVRRDGPQPGRRRADALADSAAQPGPEDGGAGSEPPPHA